VTADLAATETERVAHLSARQELEKAATQLGDRVNTHRQQMEALNARLDLLSRMQRDLVGYHEGTRSVLKAARELLQLSGIVGTVNQLLEVPPDLETAVETALGNRMQGIVVETWADAEAAIAYLKKTHGGRATFLPLDTIRPPSRLQLPSTSKVLGIGSDLVTCEKRLIPVTRLLLARTVISEDLPAARVALRAAQGGFQVVTRAGDLVRPGGSVSGGSTGRGKASSGLLARQRELQTLPSLIAEKEAALRALEAQIADNELDQEEHQSALDEMAGRHQMLRANRTTSEREQAALTRDVERAEQAAQWQQELLDRTQTQRAELDQNQQQLLAEINRLETEQTRAKTHAQELASQAAVLAAESIPTNLSQARTELAVIEGRNDSQRAILDGHQKSHSEILTRVHAKEHRAEELSREDEGLLVKMNDQRHRSTELNELITALTGHIKPAEAELDALEQRQAEAETEANQQRQALQQLEAEHNGRTLEMRRCQDEMAMLHRQILADLGLVDVDLNQDQVGQPLLPLHPLISQLPTVTELPENLEQDIQQIKVQLGQLGSVNLHASEEHEEMRSRHEYLTQQMADLEKATTDLRHIITELDQLMEQGFSVTFEAVAREFKTYFKQLFNGGDAQLVLTDPANLIETGIDIIARPPGKRSQSLNMLSGGERALTAAALIFSLLSTSPTPYCVLDEVDAMLDEANVSRFRDALTGLAQQIQFIVITHNRRTVEVANTIYGVSMGDDSVSRVISLKLDESADTSGSQDQ
jgi:chromosome segregation protein